MEALRKESRALDGLYGPSSSMGGAGDRRSFFTESMCEFGGADGKSFAELEEQGALSDLVVEKQMTGHLYKKAISGKRSWKRRYFVLKDGMLLYYDARDRPMICFDFHPKGVLPLDSCDVDTCHEGPRRDMPYGIRITHPSFGGKSLILSAETSEDQDKWYQALENCRYITYGNALKGTEQLQNLRGLLAETQDRLQIFSENLRHKKEKITRMRRKATKLMSSKNRLQNENRALKEAIRQAEEQHNITIDVPEDTKDSDDTGDEDFLVSEEEDDEEEEEEDDDDDDNDDNTGDDNENDHQGNDATNDTKEQQSEHTDQQYTKTNGSGNGTENPLRAVQGGQSNNNSAGEKHIPTPPPEAPMRRKKSGVQSDRAERVKHLTSLVNQSKESETKY